MNKNNIYLASQSPRRKEILQQLGIQTTVLPSHIDESLHLEERVEDYVMRMAAEKAEVCQQYIKQQGMPLLPILAADTTVCVDHVILGKPENEQEAFHMLKQLSGRWHEVHTAVAVSTVAGMQSLLSTTHVEMADMTDDEILGYVATGEPRDKAGAYGIQGMASVFIKSIEGSYSGVMGLPIFETAQLLKQAGIELFKDE